MWLHHNGTPVLAEGYKNHKNYQKKKKGYPKKPEYELVLMMALTHSQDAPLQNMTCRTDCTDNGIQREFMLCAVIS